MPQRSLKKYLRLIYVNLTKKIVTKFDFIISEPPFLRHFDIPQNNFCESIATKGLNKDFIGKMRRGYRWAVARVTVTGVVKAKNINAKDVSYSRSAKCELEQCLSILDNVLCLDLFL